MNANQELAFRAARYCIADLQGEWLLQPDCHSPHLSRLLARSGQHCASLITAFNPSALPCTDEENEQRQAYLRRRVESLGLAFVEGESTAADGSWRESTLLCTGMTLHIALDLGREFGQVAILHSGSDAVPHLCACWSPG